MDNIWSILQIEETHNVAEIKKAYARLAREYHPEEEPEKFLRLRKAYQAALDYAENVKENDSDFGFGDEGGEAFGEADRKNETIQASGNEEAFEEPDGETENSKVFWEMEEDEPEANPYADSEVHKEFLNIYCSGKRKNRDCWTKFFISPAFLEVSRKEEFTALMLEAVTEMEKEYPPDKEFLTALYVAYQFTCEEVVNPYHPEEKERKFQLYEGAGFDGIESIFEIARKGPVQRKMTWNDYALITAYLEYWRLVYLADNSGWHDKALEELRQITGRYAILNIQDKCRNSYDRSVHGVRVISHFFERRDLPKEVFQVVWKSLDLKSAILGRGKVLYGRIREIALERFPDIPDEEENFRELHKYISRYTDCTSAPDTPPETIKEETDALFARGDFQRALRNVEMVKEYVIKFWINKYNKAYFLERILEFYKENPEAPFADEAVAKIRHILKMRNVEASLAEDSAAPLPEEGLTISYRPFFRYWMNVNFYSARNYDGGFLRDYMNRNFPYSKEWSRCFLGFHEENSEVTAKAVSFSIGENVIEIIFHLYHAEFILNGNLMCAPFVPWEVVSRVEQADIFFLLLPMALAGYSAYEPVMEEIKKRITKLGLLPEEDVPVIADCLGSNVCQLPDSEGFEGNPAFVIPMEIYRETPEQLFGCEWYANEQVLWVFEQTREKRNYLPNGRYDFIFNMESFIGLSGRLLEGIVNPADIHFERMERMPDVVYVAPRFGVKRTITGTEVTADILSELLRQFADEKLARLEFAWDSLHSLVFLYDNKKYACICFDEEKHSYHELISLPEIYAKGDSGEVQYVPFKRGKLPNYCIHNSFATMKFHINLIFSQVGKQNGIQALVNNEWIWTTNVVKEKKYNVRKQVVGEFPVERAGIAFSEPFDLSDVQLPSGFEIMDLEEKQKIAYREELTAETVWEALALFMRGELKKVRLTWSNRHIIIMQDGGRYLMAVLDDGKGYAGYYVADLKTYMNVEDKKYPKDTFNNKMMPAYLIHNDLFRIHNCLNLLLDSVDDFTPVTMAFGEFARENPVKPRAYEEIRAELL